MDYHNSHCGYVSKSGHECGKWAVEGSPVNLCFEHMQQAFKFARDNISVVSPRNRAVSTARCPECRKMRVSYLEYERQTYICDECGYEASRKEFLLEVRSGRKNSSTRTAYEKSKSVVYYIQHGDRIKIGTSHHWQTRVSGLPHDRVLALEPGSFKEEAARHEQFSGSRVRNTEWFRMSADLQDHIGTLNTSHPEYREQIEVHNQAV